MDLVDLGPMPAGDDKNVRFGSRRFFDRVVFLRRLWKKIK